MIRQPETIAVDVAIIGTGSAGMAAYKAARAHGVSIAIIESGTYGTTCARVGCMPSKLLIAAADAAHSARQAGVFGVRARSVSIDGTAVMDRVRRERDRFVGFVAEDVASWPDAHRFRGHARFVGRNRLAIDGGPHVQAHRIIIATGSRPVWPQAWNGLGDRLIVNDDVFAWETLPESVAVVGAGVIGLEMAQALARLGVRVKLYGRGGKIGPISDPAIAATASDVLGAEVRMVLASDIVGIERDGDAVIVTDRHEGQLVRERFQYLLAATGRRPNLDRIDIEKAGVALDGNGMAVGFDRETTRIAGTDIFIAGDAAPDLALLHEASDAGRIAGNNAAIAPVMERHHRRPPLAIVFSDPNIAMVGRSWAELQAAGADFVTGSVDFGNQGRARVMGRNAGRLNVYADRLTGRFHGAELIAPGGEHLAHLLAWALAAERSVQQMLDSPFYHPVLEEGLRTALRQARDQIVDAANVPCLDCRRAA